MSQPSPSGKRVLSIDGGGFRGLGCLLVIQAITDEAHQICRDTGDPPLRPCEIFDLVFGSSTGGLIAVLLGRLGLDSPTAIQEYKALAQKLFGTDRNAFLDVLNDKKALLNPTAYEDALRALVAKYGGAADAAFSISDGNSNKSTRTAVITRREGAGTVQYAHSWETTGYDWRTWEVARQTTAAPIYVSPLSIQNKGKEERYLDAAYPDFINPTPQAIDTAKKLWTTESPGVILSVGQGYSEIAAKDVKPGRPATDKQAKPLVPSLLTNYPKPASDAIITVKRVLEQATRTNEIQDKVKGNNGYVRVDPPLKMGWELVDCFYPDVEKNFKEWLASSEGKQLVQTTAKKLVKEKPPKPAVNPVKPAQPAVNPGGKPANEVPPVAPPGTLKPHPACERPRPTTMDEYLHNYHVIFLIDDSTSMIIDPKTFFPLRRWEEARAALEPIANFALQIKVDTIDMQFLNSRLIHQGIKDTGSVMNVFDRARPPHPFRGIQRTPTGARLGSVLNECITRLESLAGNKDLYEKEKPFDIILLTDGLPGGSYHHFFFFKNYRVCRR
ncbi:hypothetical protein AX15_004098 [Amanita polypyramis BW_CC]|nr:hypothetical protein AX15_004098 [Amanita polypyramis BW_CC]